MAVKNNITVLGYGSQGRAISLNLRDSGFDITVGLRAGSRSRQKLKKDKLKAATIKDSVARADIIVVAIPDHHHKKVLTRRLFDTFEKKPSLVFLHGLSIHFNLVSVPQDIPVLLLAPHAPGRAVRENYVNSIPFSAFYAVHQGTKSKGIGVLSSLARAIGISRKNMIETTFAAEAIGDLFGEQAVLCGGLALLLKYGFETLVEAGLPPQNAYLEVAYQIDLIVELIKRDGLSGMFDSISPAARYGSAVNGPRVVGADTKKNMKKILKEIESGRFISRADKSGFKPTAKQMSQLTNRLFDKQALRFSSKKKSKDG